jgi:hypothetical protein
VEFLVISLFHETIIPMVDMKVLGYSNLEGKIKKNKMNTPSSMGNGRFHLPKCRGKVQKMGVLYIHSPKRPDPFPKLPRKKQKPKKKKLKKKGGTTV